MNEFELILLTKDHDDFDYDLLSMESNLIVDTIGKIGNMYEILKNFGSYLIMHEM